MFIENFIKQFGCNPEENLHLHVPEERAHLYHSIDGNSTEIEVLNLLNAMIICFKPKRIIETGTFLGFGTIAIVDALINNGFGFLHSLECNQENIESAELNMRKYFSKFSSPLNDQNRNYKSYYELTHADSRDFINSYKINSDADKFDFGFFDSGLGIRHLEFKAMADRGF
jgi:hypothetical protein